MFRAGTHTPRLISAPASARHLAMAQPKPCSRAAIALVNIGGWQELASEAAPNPHVGVAQRSLTGAKPKL